MTFLKIRLVQLAIAIGLIALIAAPALASPRIGSFYAKDEGSYIQLRVNWCVAPHELGDSIITTFRLWQPPSPVPVVQRRISGRADYLCNTDRLRIPDVFPSGTYAANPAVTNRTTGAFTRLQARLFPIF